MEEQHKVFGPIYEKIKSLIAADFETMAIHTEYPVDGDIERLPACFIEMTDIAPGESPGTGEVELITRWTIRILVSLKQRDHKIAVRNASARIASLLDNKCLAKYAFPAVYVGSQDDNFDHKVPQYDAWVSEFEVKIRVGENDWGKWEFYQENRVNND